MRDQDKIKIRTRKWAKANKDKIAAYKKSYREKDPQHYMLQNCKWRAKRLNIEFDLRKEDIIIPARCPVFDIELELFNSHKDRDKTASVDRIDNTKGYLKNNIKIISWRANKLKGDASLFELKALVKYMENSIENN